MSAAPVEIRGLVKRYGGIVAVDNVDLTVERGQIHGLIGSNGSGKTTLLNLISGFYTLDAGKIRIGNHTVNDHPPYMVARVGIARTFQSPKLILHASSVDNVIPAVNLRIRCTGIESMLRLPRGHRMNKLAHQEALDTLNALGLSNVIEETGGALPHGTRRLVELARAVAMRPSFILLDEPAAGLSPTELDLLIAVIKHLADSGVGVLLIEHNVPMVLDIASQITVLHQGKRLFQGTPQQLRADPDVAHSFLGTTDEAQAAYLLDH
jgi:branched-chain amino acid transport system permease protein